MHSSKISKFQPSNLELQSQSNTKCTQVKRKPQPLHITWTKHQITAHTLKSYPSDHTGLYRYHFDIACQLMNEDEALDFLHLLPIAQLFWHTLGSLQSVKAVLTCSIHCMHLSL